MGRRIAIIGAGSWGTALAIIAARAGHDVRIWSRNAVVVDSINRDHVNPVYLTGAPFPKNVLATRDIIEVVDEAELVVLAAPSHATRGILSTMAVAIRPGIMIVSATKGIETDTGKRISQLVAEVIPDAAQR